jgi:hypothetical protein
VPSVSGEFHEVTQHQNREAATPGHSSAAAFADSPVGSSVTSKHNQPSNVNCVAESTSDMDEVDDAHQLYMRAVSLQQAREFPPVPGFSFLTQLSRRCSPYALLRCSTLLLIWCYLFMFELFSVFMLSTSYSGPCAVSGSA